MKSTEKTVFEITLIVTLLLALALLPLQAWSQAGPAHGAPGDRGPIPFSTMDTDGNGKVSEAEFDAARAERMAAREKEGRPMKNMKDMPGFDVIDSDGDGMLSEAELVAHQQAHRAAMKAGGKGGGMRMPTFEDFDANADGCISRDELLAVQKERHPEKF